MITTVRAGFVAILVAALFWTAPAAAQEWFDLSGYHKLKRSDRATVELVLGAMYEAVFYAQNSIGTPVICASPRPIPGAQLIEMIDREIRTPTNPTHPQYGDSDHLAFVLVNALKAAGTCR